MRRSTILARSASVSYEIVDSEAILIYLESGEYYSLNQVGLAFWNRLDGLQTIAQHAAAISETYDAELDEVVSDLLALAEEMSARNLIEERSGEDLF